MFSSEVLNAICDGLNLNPETLKNDLKDGVVSKSAQQISFDLRGCLLEQRDLLLGNSLGQNFFTLKHSLACEQQVRAISTAILDCAKTCLPDFFEWPNGVPEGDPKKLSISEIVRKWKNGNSGIKLEIGRMLARTFHPLTLADGTPKSYKDGVDSYDQPMERVLPGLYGKWKQELGASNRPNCLGKFQLLVALGKLFNVNMLAVTPLVYSSSKVNEYRCKASKLIIDSAQSSGLKINAKRLSSLAEVIKHSKQRQTLPPLQHFAVMYEIEGGPWLLVDPNSGLASLVEDSSNIALAHKRLREVDTISPGASILSQYLDQEAELKSHLDLVIEASKRISQITKTAFEFESWQSLRGFLIAEGIYDSFEKWEDFIDLTARSKNERFDQMVIKLWNEANPEAKISSISEGQLKISELLETVLYRYLKRGEDEMRYLLQSAMLLGRAKHPLSELSLAPFRMATATISHVAYDISDEVGLETEKILYSFGLNEGQLYNVSLGAFPKEPASCEHSEKAFRFLCAQRHVGDVVERLISKREMINAN